MHRRFRVGVQPSVASRGVKADEAIEVVDLSISYGPVLAVDRLSFRAHRGEVVALLGANGAGKTSTVECLEGYRRPSSGSVSVLGLDPERDHRRLSALMGVMLQQGGMYTAMRPREAVRLFSSYYDDARDPDELIEMVGLSERRTTPWRNLSGGEQQRLSLALAMVGRPKVAFLDEPTAGIDPVGRQTIRSVVAGLREEGVCVLLTTHDLDEAERLADRVLIIDRGQLIAAGTPAELMQAGAGDELRFGGPPGIDVGGLSAAVGGTVEEVCPGEYLVQVAPTPAAVAKVTSWLAEYDLPLGEMRAGRQSLEDVFLRLTGPGTDDTDRGLPSTALPKPRPARARRHVNPRHLFARRASRERKRRGPDR